MDCVEDAYDVVFGCSFCLEDVSVAKEGYCVIVHADDSVDEMVACGVTYQGHCSFLEVFLFPWTKGHLVTHVHHEWVHAVAFDCDGHGFAFGDQGSDLLHHYGFVYCDSL